MTKKKNETMALPSFLKDFSYTHGPAIEAEADSIEDELSCWASMLYHLNNAKTEADILKMIAVELMTRNRWSILNRLKTRFNTIKKQREHKELKEFSEWTKNQ